MPELVTNGYVYIAQPPLFRIRKNKTELYLKDEKEFDQYFVDELVSVSMLKNSEGKALKGKDLKNVLQKVIKLNYLLESTSNGDNNFYLLLEQATISSFFNPQNFNDAKKSSQTLDYLLNVRREYIAFVCYLCGSLVSYVLAKRFVFESGWLKDKPRFEFVAYIFGGLIGAIITAFIFALMASLGFNNILFQKVVSGVISFFTVFVYRNYIVFRKQ